MWHEARKQEKKIRGMMVDYKRRAERRREFYEKIKQDPAQFLQVHGRPAKIHLDPAVALAADSPATMMPWQGHTDNLIDRFDVRAHLDIIPEYKALPDASKTVTDEEDRKLFYERYRTLVQNDFLGVTEDKFLHQIFMEERFGIFKPSCEDEKKKLMDKKAAIGYVYEDSTESPPRPSLKTSDSEDDDEDKEEDLSDLDLDVTVDVNELTAEQCTEMNKQSVKYGMVDDDFITYLLQDKDEADQLRLAREIEEEKAMYSGRKSRRERRALREKKLAGRKITSPPSYAARDSPTYTPMRHSTSKSRSRSPPDSGKIMFITTFGDEVSDSEKLPKAVDKISDSSAKHGKTNLKNKENVIGPQLPPRNGDEEKSAPKETSSKHSSSSDSSKSSSKKKRDVKSHHSKKKYRSKRSRSDSRSRSRSSSVSSKKSRSRSKKQSRRTCSRSRSRSYSRSTSRSRSRSWNRSRREKKMSKTRGKSPSRSRSRSKSAFSKSNLEKSESPKLPPPPVKSYYRHSLSRSNSDISNSSEDDDRSSTKSSNASSVPTSSRLQHLMGKAASDTKSKLTPQERLKRKMQLQLKKQYKADKRAQMEKTEKQLQEQQDRAEELREMAIKLRQRERERRHRMRGYLHDSDSDSTSWSRSADYSASDRRLRRHSRSLSSHSSDREDSPPRSKKDHSRSPSSRTSRRSPVTDKKSYAQPQKSSRRTSPRQSSPRRSPSRSYRQSPPRNSHSSPGRSSYSSRDSRRASPRRHSPHRSPPRKSSKQYRRSYSHSRSRSPVSKSYAAKPLVDY